MSALFQTLFSTEIFLPRGHEYLWTPRLLKLEIASNLIIAVSCLAMAGALCRILAKRALLARRAQIALGLFVFCAAATHLLDLWVIWAPRYWLDAVVRSGTAIVGAATAIALFTNRGDA